MTKISLKEINYGIFISGYIIQSYTDAIYTSRNIPLGIFEYIKYGIMLLGIILSFIQIYLKKQKKLIYINELNNILRTIFLFIIITLTCIIINERYTYQSLELIIKYTLPILYAFGILNIFEFEDISKCMKIILLIAILGYILEIGINNFNFSNIFSMSFSNSYSPFESHYFADISIAMCTFFMYYKNNKMYKYISLIFTIFTFKRLCIVFAISLMFITKFINVDKKINKSIVFFIKIFFIITPILYYWILLPENSGIFFKVFNQDSVKFTMGRSIRFSQLLYSNFKSYGLGSINDYLGVSLEMELITIMLEMSILALIVFVFSYISIAKRNFYSLLYISFVFLNLLTSHSLANVFGWLLIFIIIGTINYKNPKNKYKLKN